MSKRILIADDDDALAGLAHLLQGMGHEVALAGNAAHAVEVAAQFEPEVVILDFGMPFVDGLDAARELRRLPNGPAMMLVVLTGGASRSIGKWRSTSVSTFISSSRSRRISCISSCR